jgi:hypothetical protein
MTAARIRVMAFGQEQESTLSGLRILFRWVTPQTLEALPVQRFLGLLLALPPLGFCLSQNLHVLSNHAEASLDRLDAAAKHPPAFVPSYAEFLSGLVTNLFPVRQRLGQRLRAVLLTAEITKRSPTCLSLLVAVALDQIIAAGVAGST